MSDSCTAIIDELIALRKSKGLTQGELAKAANLAQPAIARFESKSTVPRLSTVLKISVALGKTLAVVPFETK